MGPDCVRRGASLAKLDPVAGLIAATAIVHDLILVARHGSAFEETGASVVNPWVGQVRPPARPSPAPPRRHFKPNIVSISMAMSGIRVGVK